MILAITVIAFGLKVQVVFRTFIYKFQRRHSDQIHASEELKDILTRTLNECEEDTLQLLAEDQFNDMRKIRENLKSTPRAHYKRPTRL